jgi:hypothetical protein
MPYIKSTDNRRQLLRNGEPALLAGELNYQIYYYIKHNYNNFDESIIKKFVDQFLGKTPNYQKYNDVTGVLIRCGKEIERRLGDPTYYIQGTLISIMESYDDEIAKYEDIKIKENSDVE